MWHHPPRVWNEFLARCKQENEQTIEELSYLHSRSMTILLALKRCSLLVGKDARPRKLNEVMKQVKATEKKGTESWGDIFKHVKASEGNEATSKLVLHIVGADYREGNSAAETLRVFEQLIAAFGHVEQLDHGYTELVLVLVGPNVEQRLHGTVHTSPIEGTGKSVRLIYGSEIWSSYLAGQNYMVPSAIFCFNAGVWGYDEWIPAFQLMMQEAIHTPIIITSYNALEASDDADCLEDIEIPFVWRWKHEPNPFLCLKQRASQHTLADRVLKENSCWQCICATHLK
ncbi:hypothetical protein THRCLA_05018 [Thraustotheca clavata]|uniref:Mitochondrial splicing suppressor 51-like C-terminal domain-containing protein n=1 Tax=Thraustotheca clavata TaxID=74557 RepID=A0A1V9ZX77_9STRA|nr:hypothetical protein THRCLA_05018 [Thraustotheca clavata]